MFVNRLKYVNDKFLYFTKTYFWQKLSSHYGFVDVWKPNLSIINIKLTTVLKWLVFLSNSYHYSFLLQGLHLWRWEQKRPNKRFKARCRNCCCDAWKNEWPYCSRYCFHMNQFLLPTIIWVDILICTTWPSHLNLYNQPLWSLVVIEKKIVNYKKVFLIC